MAAANFVVITNGEGCALNGTAVAASTNSVPRAFVPQVAIGCRLSLKIDRNLSPSFGGGLIRGYDMIRREQEVRYLENIYTDLWA